MFSDHNGMKRENKLKEKIEKHENTWKLNNMLLNNEWNNNEIRKEIKIIWKQMKMNQQ